jgi:hypothetical protein
VVVVATAVLLGSWSPLLGSLLIMEQQMAADHPLEKRLITYHHTYVTCPRIQLTKTLTLYSLTSLLFWTSGLHPVEMEGVVALSPSQSNKGRSRKTAWSHLALTFSQIAS